MNLLEGRISSHIRAIAVPASIGFFFNTLFNVVDTLFAGLISTDAVAALSLSFPVFFIIIAIVQGISTGSAALLANAIGAHNKSAINKITAQIMTFSLFSYFCVAVIGVSISKPLFELLGAEGDYLIMAKTYMDIIFIGSIFFVLLYAANSTLYAHGNTIVIRNFLIWGSLLNALLDPWFLFGGWGVPAMGLRGIAIATVVTMFFGFLYVLYHVRAKGYLTIRSWRDCLPNWSILLALIEQIIPASLNMMAIGIGFFVINFFIHQFGHAAVAAYGIAIRIEQLILLPAIGLAVSTLAIVGQNNGAHQYSRVQETVTISTKYGIYFACMGFVLMSFFPEQLYAIFTRDTQVVAFGVPYLRIAALISGAYIFLSIHISALQGMKRPIYPLVIGLLRQIICPLISFYIFVSLLHFGILSIWWSIFAITWTAALITVFYTRRIILNQRKIDE